jgi:Molybdopterin-binding domain of aldehyde dehydrogenase
VASQPWPRAAAPCCGPLAEVGGRERPGLDEHEPVAADLPDLPPAPGPPGCAGPERFALARDAVRFAGDVRILRLVAVDDYGVVVNPMLVDGQGYGSIAQGLGQALYEEAAYNPAGLPEAGSLLDYLLPTAAEMPPVELLETGTPNPNNPFGSKRAGEAGCIGVPPAAVSAVFDALDVGHIDMPLTPESVWRAAHPTA